ncbi:NAD(P)/FAD-dependent oxidoreductase [Larsenimonas suaedae]|uniref:FAD-binding oxidoreductase n=1 Tax=Larsenimonas suaedae TaxID=1851019 RepID=A0ABU1GWZ4_9GAMM|nr:FAD-binding oxidoreductase [Larsenimonas suaedae]MCM2973133.1 FAD-binding oxidoreductase [Larsenimonas suaedae]MDR5896570.1 FAD-binding oxidoreductase [Larsenimonas suaedae]
MSASRLPLSYYAATASDASQHAPLEGALDCDVCVVGGGFTGVSTALHLIERGFDVVLLEAEQLGFGASGRNGGQIVNSYSRDMDVIEARYGAETARALGSMAFEGNRIIRERITRYAIDCDLKEGNLFAACTERQWQGLKDHRALWARYGHSELELLGRDAYRREVGSKRYTGVLIDHSGGHLHPLNLLLGQVRAFEAQGGRVFEGSPVISVTPGEPACVRTERGEVRASKVVLAGNAYMSGLLPDMERRSMPASTQIITTEPLTDAQARALLPTDRAVEDCNYLLDYYRLTADQRLLYGGGVSYGGQDPDSIEGAIRPKLLTTFPELSDVRIDYAWSGNFLLTLNRLPQFGRVEASVYYAQGYSGHGVTCSHLAGCLVAEALAGDGSRFDAFAGIAHRRLPGGRTFSVPLSALGAWYYQLRDRLGW